MDNDKWIQDLRSRLEGYESEPPKDLWAGIHAGIQKGEAKPRKSAWDIWRLSGIAAAVLLLMGIGTVLWLERPTGFVIEDEVVAIGKTDGELTLARPTEETNVTSAREEVEKVKGESQSNKVANDSRIEQDAKIATAIQRSREEESKTPTEAEYVKVEPSLEPAFAESEQVETTSVHSESNDITHEGHTRAEKSQEISVPTEGSTLSPRTLMVQQPVRRDSRIALLGAGSPNSIRINSPEDGLLYGFRDSSLELHESRPVKRRSIDDVLTSGSVLLDHKQPLSLGLSVQQSLQDGWGIETGLIYHRLGTTFRKFRGDDRPLGRQSIEYIGVPLGITYDVWGSRGFLLYVAGGAEAALCIRRTLQIEDHGAFELYALGSDLSTPLDKLQWSLHAGVGMQYAITRKLALFLKPEVRYYINNKSDIETIYKTKPLNFDFTVGIRWNLSNIKF